MAGAGPLRKIPCLIAFSTENRGPLFRKMLWMQVLRSRAFLDNICVAHALGQGMSRPSPNSPPPSLYPVGAADTARPAIRIRDLVKSFGALLAVDHVSVDIRPGEFFMIVGPSG